MSSELDMFMRNLVRQMRTERGLSQGQLATALARYPRSTVEEVFSVDD